MNNIDLTTWWKKRTLKAFIIIFLLCFLFLFFKKPKLEKCYYSDNYFTELNFALQKQAKGASHAIIDLNRLDNNIATIKNHLGNSFNLRLVTKSLPSFELLDYLMKNANTKSLMVFSEPFIAEILNKYSVDTLDVLLGKPLPVDAVYRLSNQKKWNSVCWLIDTEERLNEYLTLAKSTQTKLKIALEINIGLQRGGFDNAEQIISQIKANPNYLELKGLMGYDGHVPYVPFYINKNKQIEKAFADAQNRYNAFVDILKKNYSKQILDSMIFNSGGTRTYFYYKNYNGKMSVNDIAMGSGFLAPNHFSELYNYGHQPASFLASCVLKKIETAKLPHVESISPIINWWNPNLSVSYFMLGGGWPGNVVEPKGIQHNTFWDGDEISYKNLLPNQSILSSSKQSTLKIDDYVFTQPWEGDGILCFRNVLLYKNKKIIGEWSTFDGGN